MVSDVFCRENYIWFDIWCMLSSKWYIVYNFLFENHNSDLNINQFIFYFVTRFYDTSYGVKN
jgi:hypothetical protein